MPYRNMLRLYDDDDKDGVWRCMGMMMTPRCGASQVAIGAHAFCFLNHFWTWLQQ